MDKEKIMEMREDIFEYKEEKKEDKEWIRRMESWRLSSVISNLERRVAP